MRQFFAYGLAAVAAVAVAGVMANQKGTTSVPVVVARSSLNTELIGKPVKTSAIRVPVEIIPYDEYVFVRD